MLGACHLTLSLVCPTGPRGAILHGQEPPHSGQRHSRCQGDTPASPSLNQEGASASRSPSRGCALVGRVASASPAPSSDGCSGSWDISHRKVTASGLQEAMTRWWAASGRHPRTASLRMEAPPYPNHPPRHPNCPRDFWNASLPDLFYGL